MCKQMLGLPHKVEYLPGKGAQGLVPPSCQKHAEGHNAVLFHGTCFSHRWAVGCRQVGIGGGVTAAEVRNGDPALAPTARSGQTVGCAPPSPLSGKTLG